MAGAARFGVGGRSCLCHQAESHARSLPARLRCVGGRNRGCTRQAVAGAAPAQLRGHGCALARSAPRPPALRRHSPSPLLRCGTRGRSLPPGGRGRGTGCRIWRCTSGSLVQTVQFLLIAVSSSARFSLTFTPLNGGKPHARCRLATAR
jgi:hypothetical protein